MTRKGISFQIFGCLLMLFVANSLAAPTPNVLESILNTLKNIEDLIRTTSDSMMISRSPTIVKTSKIGTPQFVVPREVVLNVDPYEDAGIREILNLGRRGSRSSSVKSNANDNAKKIDRLRDDDDDDDFNPDRPIFRLGYNRRKPRLPLYSDENSNANSNVNSNVNSNAMREAQNQPRSGVKAKIIRVPYGSRSLVRSRNKDLNRNVNTNTNTNTNNDDEYDY